MAALNSLKLTRDDLERLRSRWEVLSGAGIALAAVGVNGGVKTGHGAEQKSATAAPA